MALSQAWPRVLVIVLNWNGADDTLACLASLQGVDYPAFGVLVIDNGSRRSVCPAVRAAYPAVDCIELPINQGYAGGNNVGLRRALEMHYDFAYVLNNDVVVDSGALRAAVAAARSDGVAAVGGKVLAFDDPGRLWMTYGGVDYRQSLVSLAGWGERDTGQYDEPRDVEWVPGCALLLSCGALRDVGTFDEDFFAYHEDVDWCASARERGWRIRYTPDAIVRHRGNRTLGGPAYVSPRKYLSARSTVLFARKHATTLQKIKLWTCIVLTLPFVFLRRLPTGEAGGVWLKVRGWLDGVRRRQPPFRALGLR
ncbi:MAG: glycosyltransferase family 2 protein [Deltaproteobacteria bacterium]|nr:glycosyltransferase family 2 protein [Deltaproteobacteria bacterium]